MNGKKAKDLRRAAKYITDNKMRDTKTHIEAIDYKFARDKKKRTSWKDHQIVLTQCLRWVYQNLKKDYKKGNFTINREVV